MIIISSPIYGRHNEVGGYRVLPQILVPHVAKPSHHLVLSPGQGGGDHHWLDWKKPTWGDRPCTGWRAPSRPLRRPPCCLQEWHRCSTHRTWSGGWQLWTRWSWGRWTKSQWDSKGKELTATCAAPAHHRALGQCGFQPWQKRSSSKTCWRKLRPTLMLRSTSVVSTTVAMASIMSRPISTVFLAWSRQASGNPDTQ